MSRYVALLDGGRREVPVEITRRGPGLYAITLGERTHEVDARTLEPGRLSLLLGTRSRGAVVDARGALFHARAGSAGVVVEVVEARRLALRRAPAGAGWPGRAEVAAPLAGKVTKVLAAPGARVTRGQVLVVTEAMRLEVEARSPKDGTVVEVRVREGEEVVAGAGLCVVD